MSAARHSKQPLALLIGTLLIAMPSWNATAVNMDGKSNSSFHRSFAQPRSIEGLLAQSLVEITRGQYESALETIDTLLNIAPNFKLAHLVRGDLLMARTRQIASFGNANNAPEETILDFQEEAKVRLEHYLAQQSAQRTPEYLWQLDGEYRHAIVVDTGRSRLYLYRNDQGTPRYVADFYVTIGKNGIGKEKEGDKRTPLGVYFTSKPLQRKLPDFYGSGAIPLNYPNEWDRHQGKNGHGIWLHGTPTDTYSRAPRASDGCIVLSNQDLEFLKPMLKDGKIPVIIARNAELASDTLLSAQQQALMREIEDWRSAWQTQDTERYLGYYSSRFFTRTHDFDRWAAEKRRKQAGKTPAEITLSNISVFRYPSDQQDMAVVTFEQDFKAAHLDDRMKKRQYWVLENKRWKILYEGAI